MPDCLRCWCGHHGRYDGACGNCLCTCGQDCCSMDPLEARLVWVDGYGYVRPDLVNQLGHR